MVPLLFFTLGFKIPPICVEFLMRAVGGGGHAVADLQQRCRPLRAWRPRKGRPVEVSETGKDQPNTKPS